MHSCHNYFDHVLKVTNAFATKLIMYLSLVYNILSALERPMSEVV